MDMLYVQVFLLTVISSPLLVKSGMPEISSACLDRGEKTLNFNCGHGKMIKITKTFYGQSSSGMCQYQSGDCVQDDYQQYSCVGKDYCSINLSSGTTGRAIANCTQEKKSSYYQVNYECVPVSLVKDVCDTPNVITDQKGYLATPRYPSNYEAGKTCSVTFRVESYQKIRLFVVDMVLEINTTSGPVASCSDHMLAKDNKKTLTLCTSRFNYWLMPEWNNELAIEFKSNSKRNNKGFWIYYEAYPTLTTTTKKATTPKYTQAPPHHNIGSETQHNKGVIPVTKTVSNVSNNTVQKLPFAAIVGGVIGTLSLILVILLVLLLVKWTRERKRKRDKNQFIEVQNPGYRNSNEFQPSVQRHDICYNYIECA